MCAGGKHEEVRELDSSGQVEDYSWGRCLVEGANRSMFMDLVKNVPLY